mmetsp:Transcript_9482/g.27311  ORF Transcript_9482/g.27311 Transcript_9482/m.27311 type:complete len:507 (-) Transcript_9482:148-1668(-)
MPPQVAHRWGQRMINLTHIYVICPKDQNGSFHATWCDWIWVSVIEGNAQARRARSELQEGSSPASSIKVLSFEGDTDGRPCRFFDIPSVQPGDPPPSPVDLSNLEEMRRLPCTIVSFLLSRRQWRTPSLRVMTFTDHGCEAEEHIAEWASGCEHLEVLDSDGCIHEKTEVLGMLPTGHSLARLRSIGPLKLQSRIGSSVAALEDHLASLRQALLDRGCRRTLRELSIAWNIGGAMQKAALREVALLSEQVMHPDALQKPQLVEVDSAAGRRGRREMDLELIGWMKNESRQVQKIVRKSASLADGVCFDHTGPGSLTDPDAAANMIFFPRADTFRCSNYFVRETQLDGLVKTVANSMPKCRRLCFGTSVYPYDREAPSKAVTFLEALTGQMGGQEGRRFSVEINIPVRGILLSDNSHPWPRGFPGRDPLVKWAKHDLPPVDEVHIAVLGRLSKGSSTRSWPCSTCSAHHTPWVSRTAASPLRDANKMPHWIAVFAPAARVAVFLTVE